MAVGPDRLLDNVHNPLRRPGHPRPSATPAALQTVRLEKHPAGRLRAARSQPSREVRVVGVVPRVVQEAEDGLAAGFVGPPEAVVEQQRDFRWDRPTAAA